jgi:hypothetical protein
MTEALSDWLDRAVLATGTTNARELVGEQVVQVVLDLARDAAHNITRPAAPIATFALGLAVASGASIAELESVAAKISAATLSSPVAAES